MTRGNFCNHCTPNAAQLWSTIANGFVYISFVLIITSICVWVCTCVYACIYIHISLYSFKRLRILAESSILARWTNSVLQMNSAWSEKHNTRDPLMTSGFVLRDPKREREIQIILFSTTVSLSSGNMCSYFLGVWNLILGSCAKIFRQNPNWYFSNYKPNHLPTLVLMKQIYVKESQGLMKTNDCSH